MKMNSKKELDAAIIELEKKKVYQQHLVIEQYQQTMESLRPGNLVKGAFRRMRPSGPRTKSLLTSAAGLGFGMLTNNLLWGNSSSMIKRLLGKMIKAGVAKAALSNIDKMKDYGVRTFKGIFKSK